jgi:hypothetical protein
MKEVDMLDWFQAFILGNENDDYINKFPNGILYWGYPSTCMGYDN